MSQEENCENCYAPLSPMASDDGLYHWCFLVKDSKGEFGFSEVRLSSEVGDRDEMLVVFEQEMPNLPVVGYTNIPKKYLEDKRQIFVVIDGELRLNPEVLPLFT